MATQENSPVFVAQTLAQVVDMLRTTELYSPSFAGFNTSKTDDQLTNDLFTGLIHVSGQQKVFIYIFMI